MTTPLSAEAGRITAGPHEHNGGPGEIGPAVIFGRETCGNLSDAESREWLVTNGRGGYASGTIAGTLTRRYHGLLVAALKPPVGRSLLVAKADETLSYGGREHPLYANRWAGGHIDPEGYKNIEQFRLDGMIPVWTFGVSDVLIEKRIWMNRGENTTYVRYKVLRAGGPIGLSLKILVNYRDFHGETHSGNWRMDIRDVKHGLRVEAFQGATPFYLFGHNAEVLTNGEWYYNFEYKEEMYRGLPDREDHLHAGTFSARLTEGDAFTFVASLESVPILDGEAELGARKRYERGLLPGPGDGESVSWIDHVRIAADQFIVDRPSPEDPEGKSIIAGYHWFCDWGRDTMVSLPGLTLATGRPEIARSIIRTFARYVDRGMLPNQFPDGGTAPEYNTADATLWYIEAVRYYYEKTEDERLVREIWPVLEDIIAWHQKGTRHGIHVDPGDGLLYAGEPGVQLTWMDAKIGEWVVTPRIGKPVEINALWCNALVTMSRLARDIGRADGYESLASIAVAGFQRFWRADAGYCYDVIDGPDGDDTSLRPNQIFAVSLPSSALTESQRKGVVDICAKHLLTSYGLRSLAPEDARYAGHYEGNQRARDAAYHQGTVWGWLLGPFALAHLRVYRDPEKALKFLEPMARHLSARGLGTMSEIFDGDPPFTPRGCIAQAWTVAEVLRARYDIGGYTSGSPIL